MRTDIRLSAPLLLGGAIAALASLSSPAAAAGQPLAVGLSAVGSEWFGDEDLLFFVPEHGDQFGFALATGDFNGDGAADLATGIPGHNGIVGSGCIDCGIVVVRFGVPGSGLAGGLASTVLSQQFVGSPDPAQPEDVFGLSLAAGDFNGDGRDDLAVGVPRNNTGAQHAGGVSIHYGLPEGIQTVGEHFLRQAALDIPGTPEAFDRFGSALAVGDFDGDGFDDLAVGVPYDYVSGSGFEDAGSVVVLHGGVGGLMPYLGYDMYQGLLGLLGTRDPGDRFGEGLATGDFDANGYDDLAIGVPGEDGEGAIQVVFGSQWGLLFAENVLWWETSIGGLSESGDTFGFELAAGDFDGDGHDDLAIGAPFEDLGLNNVLVNAGAAFTIYGSPFRFDLSRTQYWEQGNFVGPGHDESDDLFGFSLVAADFDADGYDDLVVGTPREDTPVAEAGQVSAMMGSPSRLTTSRRLTVLEGVGGLPGALNQSSMFGWALAAGDFDGDGHADLVIGAPDEQVPGEAPRTGAEIVLRGSLFGDGFENGFASRWSAGAF
ncbi:MAG: hypothetical protein AMXMBFR36_30380 [Acidobacteriota bacterium]